MSFIHSPIVSVIMPVFNSSRTLREAIDSVLNQTVSDLELIVCNDASTDDTRSILENISDKRLKVIHNHVNLGPGLSRNRAIEIARGKSIALIDADDTWAPQRLEILLKAAGSSQTIIVFDDILECHDTPSGMIPWRLLRGKKAFGGNGKDPVDVPPDKFIRLRRWLIKPLIPSIILKKYNIKQSSRPTHEDNEFFLEIMSKGIKFKFVPNPMYYYRIMPGSATAQISRTTSLMQVLEKSIPEFENFPVIYSALQEKIKSVSRENQYILFVKSIKNRAILRTLSMAIKSPWFIFELIQRCGYDIVYHTHRIWHGGRARGTR